MDFFNKIGDSIVNAAQEVSGKAKDMTDIAKLQSECKAKEETLEKQYLAIGKKFYQENKDVIPEGYTSLFNDVEATTARVNAIKDEIANLKGEKKCPNCGATVAADAIFCAGCGAKMAEVVEAEVITENSAKKCSNCGAEVADDAIFCTECGTKLVEDAE